MKLNLYPPQKKIDGGNHTTAARWVHILNSLGHHASIREFDVVNCLPDEVEIFFNAAKSANRIAEFKRVCSNSARHKVVIVLSGTDLKAGMLELDETQAAMNVADALVAYEPSAMEKLTVTQRDKAVLVPHSALSVPIPEFSFQDNGLNVISVSHIRSEKNLAAYFRCLDNFQENQGLKFHHVGGTIDKNTAAEVMELAESNSNIRLHGKQTFEQSIAMIKAADLLVHPSLVEGFPNVIVEAIVNGTPVALSRIPAHTQTFSQSLPKTLFFDTDCLSELRQLLQNFVTDSTFRREIQHACDGVAEQFNPEFERNGLLTLLQKIE